MRLRSTRSSNDGAIANKTIVASCIDIGGHLSYTAAIKSNALSVRFTFLPCETR